MNVRWQRPSTERQFAVGGATDLRTQIHLACYRPSPRRIAAAGSKFSASRRKIGNDQSGIPPIAQNWQEISLRGCPAKIADEGIGISLGIALFELTGATLQLHVVLWACLASAAASKFPHRSATPRR